MKEHEKRFLERTKAVRDACNGLDNTATRFEAAVRNAWGTMDKSASEYGTRMAQTIEEVVRNLNRQPTTTSFSETEKFHQASVEALNKIIKTVRKYLPKLRRGLRVEMAALNVALGKMEASVRALGLALDQSPGSKIELVQKDILHFAQIHADLLKLRAENTEQTKSLNATVTKEQEVVAKVDDLSSNPLFQELIQDEASLKAKENEIRQFLQPIAKPLSKLERSVSESKNQSLDVGTLHALIEKPVEAIITGQPFAMTQLLNQLDEALTHGNLEIEERRRRRAEETIQQVRNGAVGRLRGDYLTAQANVQETVRQLKAAGLFDTKSTLDQSLAATRSDKESLTGQITELQRRIDSLSKIMAREKTSLEKQVTELTNKPIRIQAD